MLMQSTAGSKCLKAAAGAVGSCRRLASPSVHVKAAATATSPETTKIVNEKVAPLFTPIKVGRYQLEHRLVYPPLTRNRATMDNVPQPLMAEYYSQRATKGGLMISEGTYISDRAVGYPAAAGIYNDQQVEAWKPVVQAVHDKGAFFFCQLFHCGRAAHPDMIHGQRPIAPSPIPPSGESAKVYLGNGQFGELPVPEELTKEGIEHVVDEYRQAARRAINAGFDGVELHGANGYLLAQFTSSTSNRRTDEYGGSIENRCRFALEVAKAVVAEVGADRVGYRMSPFTDFLDCLDQDTPYATYTYLTEQLNKLDLAYIHLVEGRVQGNTTTTSSETVEPFRKVWKNAFIAAGGYNADNAGAAVASGHADLIAIGRLWIANPDLPKRFALGAKLNKYDRDTFYAPGPKGYIDYPFLEEEQK